MSSNSRNQSHNTNSWWKEKSEAVTEFLEREKCVILLDAWGNTSNTPCWRIYLTRDALVQLATAVANPIKAGREDATPSEGEQISTERKREEEDKSHISLSGQRQKVRESVQLGSQKNKDIRTEEDVE